MTLWKTADEFPGSISLPYGVKTSHTWHEIGQILRIINDLDIQTFFELGSHVGGLASILLPLNQYRDFVYFGIEIDGSIIYPTIKPRIFVADILSDVAVDVVRRTKLNRKSFIYCDGGDKIKEMGKYFSLLNSGDVIACHDYFDFQLVKDLPEFGIEKDCRCKPEVRRNDLTFLFDNSEFVQLPDYLLYGTRIMGFMKR